MSSDWDLVVLEGPSFGARVALNPAGTTIGRSDQCSFRVQGEGLSRTHAWFKREGEVWFVYDLRSTNGVFLNGERVCKAPLGPRDVIGLGRSVIVKLAEPRPTTAEADAMPPPGGGDAGSSAPAEVFAFLPKN